MGFSGSVSLYNAILLFDRVVIVSNVYYKDWS